MPQTAPVLNLFIRFGAYEPSTGFHFSVAGAIDQTVAEELATELAKFLTTDVVISRWEGALADGTVFDSGALGTQGVIIDDFDDFRDCTHITWQSGGTLGASGNYIPGRNDKLWEKGVPTADLNAAMVTLRAAMLSVGVTDSEGFGITSWRRFTVSRRNRMRLAP